MRLSFGILLIFFTLSVSGQVSNNLGVWVDHLSYTKSVDIAENNGIAYVATEQGLYRYQLSDRVIQRISKVNGLSDVGLSCLAYSDRYQEYFVGYENGNLDIVSGTEVSSFPDIRLSGNFSGLKRINHIHILDSVAYIATDFGIVAYDINAGLVREAPYIIGPNGSTLAVYQVEDDGEKLYAATEDGLYSADLNSAKFFFENWDLDPTMSRPIDHLAFFDNKLFVNRNIEPNSDSILYREAGQWNWFPENEIADNRDLRNSRESLIVVNSFSARAYDANFSFIKNWNSTTVGDTAFLPVAAVMGSNDQNFWIADNANGIYNVFQIFPFSVVPNSPKTKNSFRIQQDNGRMWVAPGAYDQVGTPVFNNDGIFTLLDLNWTNFPNSQFAGAKDIVAVIPKPSEPGRYYASSYGNGILELELVNNQLSLIREINESTTNGALPSIGGNGAHRVSDFAADEEGNVWFPNAITDRPLGVIRPDGTVESFSLGASGSGANVLKIMVTSGGQVWQQVRNNGVLVTRLENGLPQETARLSAVEGSGNLPSESVLSFAEDQDGEVWIGTNEGLAVLFSPENIFEPNRSFDSSPIIIDEDGDNAGERVLGSESVVDIEVDGANKKWFGTANNGVFYTSGNGRTQLDRFNKFNSPLPSDVLLDIEIDDVTGMVYFGTDQGIVSYQGQATAGEERMTDVFAYPNPVEPGYTGPILIRGLVTNAQVKITDIEGNIVFETVAEGGQAIWNGRNFDGLRVASGVYLAFISDDLGLNTEVAKIMMLN